jgi:hypothetical protein
MGCEGGDTCSLLHWLVDKKINVELDNEYPLAWRTQMCKLKGYAFCDIFTFILDTYLYSVRRNKSHGFTVLSISLWLIKFPCQHSLLYSLSSV